MNCLISAGVAALLLCVPAHMSIAAPAQQQEAALHTSGDILADFADLFEKLKRAHFNLHETVSASDYERLYRQMAAEIRFPENRLDVARRFQRFVAYGGIAHARIDAATGRYDAWRDGGGSVFPLFLRFEGKRAFVLENRSGLNVLAEGDEILALDGVAIGTWFDRLRPHISADSDYMAAALLEFRFPRLLWLDVGYKPSFTLTLAGAEGMRDVVIPARTAADIRAAEHKGRLHLDPEARSARVLQGGIGYLRPGPFYNTEPGAADMYDPRSYRAFIDGAMQDFQRSGVRSLLIDLRDNPGGDNSFSDHLVSWFASRPFRFASRLTIRVSPETTASNAARLATSIDRGSSPSMRMAELYARSKAGDLVPFAVEEGRPRADGQAFRDRVFVLVDRHSYSNAALLAALVQDYRFGVVIGEETADLATTLGALETFTLPRTKIVVSYPKAQIVRPSGSLLRRGVVPDITIRTPRVQDESDPVLRQAIAIASAPARRKARGAQ